MYESAVVRASGDETLSAARRPRDVDYGKLQDLLRTRDYGAFARANSDNFELLGSALRLLTRTLCIRRVRGQQHGIGGGQLGPICGEVPAPLVHTLTLAHTPAQRGEYERFARQLLPNLYTAGGDGEGGRRDLPTHRLLCHLTHSPLGVYLGAVRAGSSLTTSTDPVTAAATVARTALRALCQRGKSGLMPVPRERIQTAELMCNLSPKHAALLVLINNIVFQQQQKLIVFESWPVSQFVTETLLGVLGVPYKSMRADHNAATREKSVAEFNSADDPDRVFLISLR
jgi:hypothetical protein